VLEPHLAGPDQPDPQLRRFPCPAVRVRHEPSVTPRIRACAARSS
jgi:hypothetical protein